MSINKQLILQLYKDLYKYGQRLTYSDKDYYFKYIRDQFQSVEPTDTKRIEILYNVWNILKLYS